MFLDDYNNIIESHKSLLVFLTFCKFQNKTANTHSIRKDLKIYLSILKDSWMYQLAIFITFVVTLAVFPSVTALVQPPTKGMKMQLVMLIHTNTLNCRLRYIL